MVGDQLGARRAVLAGRGAAVDLLLRRRGRTTATCSSGSRRSGGSRSARRTAFDRGPMLADMLVGEGYVDTRFGNDDHSPAAEAQRAQLEMASVALQYLRSLVEDVSVDAGAPRGGAAAGRRARLRRAALAGRADDHRRPVSRADRRAGRDRGARPGPVDARPRGRRDGADAHRRDVPDDDARVGVRSRAAGRARARRRTPRGSSSTSASPTARRATTRRSRRSGTRSAARSGAT